MAPPKLLNIDIGKVIGLYNGGLSSFEIGRMLNCSDSYVRGLLKKHGIARRKKGAWQTIKANINEEKINKIRELYSSGLSARKVALMVGLGKSKVREIVKGLGIGRTKSQAQTGDLHFRKYKPAPLWQIELLRKSRIGKHHSVEAKAKISAANVGRVVSAESRVLMSLRKKGKHTGNENPFFGKKHSMETRKILSAHFKGVPVEQWDGFANPRTGTDYTSHDYKKWRNKVYERDNFTCQLCFKKGGKLAAHHVKSWAKYPELRYDANNGVALCDGCHRSIRRKEEIYEQIFIQKQKGVDGNANHPR